MDLLDAHAARRCPVRVVFDQLPPDDAEPAETSAAVQLRQAVGAAFGREILETLGRRPGTVRIDEALTRAGRVAATERAMDGGAALIIGGRLPDDRQGRRAGRPDLLLRSSGPGRPTYHPIEVEAHRLLRPAPGTTVTVSPLDDLHDTRSLADTGPVGGHRSADGLQLAHHHRMLEAAGRAAPGARGGVIGSERRLVWFDLDLEETGDPSVLQRYDREFSHRLDAVAAARAGTSVVEPVKIHECATCPWRHHCLPVVEERRCVSTVQGVGKRAWRAYRAVGIHTIDQLAEFDGNSESKADAWNRAGTQLSDVVEDDTAFLGAVADHVDGARALAWHAGHACLRRGLDQLDVPAFDREIDIDMESGVSGLAYLWGTYEDRADRTTFDADWSADPELAAARVFDAFWRRLGELRAEARRAGQTIGFYCWHDQAEISALRSGALAAHSRLGTTTALREVEEFLSEGLLVDLCRIARRDLITGGSKSLKTMAPMAGFAWRDPDPSGATSMVWHVNAVDGQRPEAERRRWRNRLIEYNEDDVRAEATVRRWMRETSFVPVAELRPG